MGASSAAAVTPTEPSSPATGDQGRARPTRPLPHRSSIVVLALGFVVVALLTWASHTSEDNNENHLLGLQARMVATALEVALPTIQSELVAGYEAAASTDGTAAFQSLMAPETGATSGFASVSLWRLSTSGPHLITTVGSPPGLLSASGGPDAFFARARPSTQLHVTPILPGPPRRLGYAEVPPGSDGLAVYAESPLPSSHRVAVPRNASFADLNFALYLGRTTSTGNLIAATIPLPITGRHAVATVPFGDTSITFVATLVHPLGSSLSRDLPTIIAIAGTVLALLAAAAAEYMVRRREQAEELAEDNERLYSQQLGIAQTLQHALLPEELPAMPGVDFAVRYLPGGGGIEVGGDWYDVVRLDDDRCFFVIGDVSGRGLRAATTMASLRYAIRAFASQGDTPDELLAKLSDLLSVEHDDHFATVLCGYLDLSSRRLVLADAGHFPPLLIEGSKATYLDVPLGPPVGVPGGTRPPAGETVIGTSGTVLAFTDGLVERRGEHLDVGLERLRQAATQATGSVEDVLSHLIDTLTPDGSSDDIAIVGVQWNR